MDSNTVWIVLIIAIALILVLFMFRRQLREFILKVTRAGVELELKNNQSTEDHPVPVNKAKRGPGTRIIGNIQFGKHNRIENNQSNASIEDNKQIGGGNIISNPNSFTNEHKKRGNG